MKSSSLSLITMPINEPLYALVPQHGELAGPLQDEMNKLFRQLPQEVETKSARENLKRAAVYYERFDNTVTNEPQSHP